MFAQHHRYRPQFIKRQLILLHQYITIAYDCHQFIFQEECIFQLWLPYYTFNHTDIYLTILQSCLDISRISTQNRDGSLRILSYKGGKHLGKHILGYRSTGTDTYLATIFLTHGIHIKIQLLIFLHDFFTVIEQLLSGICKRDSVAHTVEQTYFIFGFQLLNMLADGRLTDKQFLGSLRKTEVLCNTAKNFQTDIYHNKTGIICLQIYTKYNELSSIILIN